MADERFRRTSLTLGLLLPKVKVTPGKDAELARRESAEQVWGIVHRLSMSPLMNDEAPDPASFRETVETVRWLAGQAQDVDAHLRRVGDATDAAAPSIAPVVAEYLDRLQDFRLKWSRWLESGVVRDASLPGAGIVPTPEQRKEITAALSELRHDMWWTLLNLAQYCHADAAAFSAAEKLHLARIPAGADEAGLGGLATRVATAAKDMAGFDTEHFELSGQPSVTLISSTLPCETRARLGAAAQWIQSYLMHGFITPAASPYFGVRDTLDALYKLTEETQSALDDAGPAAAALEADGSPSLWDLSRKLMQDVRSFNVQYHPQYLAFEEQQRLQQARSSEPWPGEKAFLSARTELAERATTTYLAIAAYGREHAVHAHPERADASLQGRPVSERARRAVAAVQGRLTGP